MTWLIWKDFRCNRLAVYGTLFLLLMPQMIAVFNVLVDVYGLFGNLSCTPRWREYFGVSAFFSLIISQVIMAIIGGNAIAGERVDRSAEFLFSLPIARCKILASKLILALVIAAVIWLVNVPVTMLHFMRSSSPMSEILSYVLPTLLHIAIVGSTFFCVSWFLSSILSSPTFAMAGGLFAPPIVVACLQLVCTALFNSHPKVGEDYSPTFVLLYPYVCLTLAAVCFALGTWRYLRRVEP